MTVSSTANKVTDLGNGVATGFTFSFIGVSDSDIGVIFTDSNGVSTTLVEGIGPTQYQLALNAALPGQLWGLGGIVTYNPSGTPIPSGSTVTIVRELPETQDFSITNQSSYGAYLRATEQALDYTMMVIQQVSESQGRAIVVPVVDVNAPTPLPPAAQRANKILAFDGDGNPIAASLTAGTGLISSAMQPVVAASTLAAGRAAFGLRGLAVLDPGSGISVVGNNANVLFTPNSIAVNTGIGAANHLQKLKVTGPVTLTLARASSLFNGFGFWVENLFPGGNCTIAIDANDKIENGSTGASVILPPGFSGFMTTNAAASGTWWLESSWNGAVGLPASVAAVPGTWRNLSIDVATNTTLTCSVDAVTVTDGTFCNSVTPTGGIDFGVAGLGGLDTGSIAQANNYSVWVVYNPIARLARWMASLQATVNGTFLASVPAGYTQFARLGTVRTAPAAATLLGTRQRGRDVQYVVGLGSLAAGRRIINGTQGNPATGPTWVGTSLAAFVPPNAAATDVYLAFGPNSGVVSCIAAPTNSYGVVDSTTNPPPLSFSSGQTGGAGINFGSSSSGKARFIGLNGGSSVFYASNNGNSGLFCDGWVESI